MTERTDILQALIVPKIEEISEKINYWAKQEGWHPIKLPPGQGWCSEKSLTLEKFLEMHPCPQRGDNITIYGIAWEFMWGEEPPMAVTEARNELLKRAQMNKSLSEMEKLWLKLIRVDPEYF